MPATVWTLGRLTRYVVRRGREDAWAVRTISRRGVIRKIDARTAPHSYGRAVLLAVDSHRRRRTDVAVAAVLTVAGLAELLRQDLGPHARALDVVTLLMPAALVLRRQRPMLVTLVEALAFTGYALVASDGAESIVQAVSLLVAGYSAAAYLARREAVLGLALVVVAGSVHSLAFGYDAGSTVVNTSWGVGAWLIGLGSRRRDRQTAVAREQAVSAEERRLTSDVEARAAERDRIARELHDVVAHAVTVIVLQARGGRRWVDTDPGAAREAFDAVEQMGVEALAELRRLLALLGEPGVDVADIDPRPGLHQVATLVENVRSAGLEVTVSQDPDLPALSPGVDLSAYRVVQEALTNALRHGHGSPAAVRLRAEQNALELLVTNGPVPAGRPTTDGAGHGLAGLRERVRVFGGSLEAGLDDDGTFRVLARLPVLAVDR